LRLIYFLALNNKVRVINEDYVIICENCQKEERIGRILRNETKIFKILNALPILFNNFAFYVLYLLSVDGFTT